MERRQRENFNWEWVHDGSLMWKEIITKLERGIFLPSSFFIQEKKKISFPIWASLSLIIEESWGEKKRKKMFSTNPPPLLFSVPQCIIFFASHHSSCISSCYFYCCFCFCRCWLLIVPSVSGIFNPKRYVE